MADIVEIYGNVATNLQNILIAFLAFIILLSVFVFFPYYFLVDSYKVIQNMDFLFNKIDKSLESLNVKLRNYDEYKITIQQIPYNISVGNTKALKSNLSLVVKKEMLDPVYENIINISENIGAIESINAHYNFIGKTELKNMKNEITKFEDFVDKKLSRAPINISVADYENFLILLSHKIYPPSVEKKKVDLEKDYDSLSNDVKNLSVPILGSFPFRLNQVLLFFPAIIAIGFPFISIQFAKLMNLNNKIIFPAANRADENQVRAVKNDILSWLDPLQKWPQKVYSIVAILLPCAIFTVFFVSIFLLFYNNIEYSEQLVLNEKDLLFLSEDTRIIYFIGNLAFGAVSFATSFYLMWRSRN